MPRPPPAQPAPTDETKTTAAAWAEQLARVRTAMQAGGALAGVARPGGPDQNGLNGLGRWRSKGVVGGCEPAYKSGCGTAF